MSYLPKQRYEQDFVMILRVYEFLEQFSVYIVLLVDLRERL